MNRKKLLVSINEIFVTGFPFEIKYNGEPNTTVKIYGRSLFDGKKRQKHPVFEVKGHLLCGIIISMDGGSIAQDVYLGKIKDINTIERFKVFFYCWRKLLLDKKTTINYYPSPVELFYKTYEIFQMKRELTEKSCNTALRAKRRLGKILIFNE